MTSVVVSFGGTTTIRINIIETVRLRQNQNPPFLLKFVKRLLYL